jgi:hypothetical protein
MVDAADLKSASRKGVWVRIPPSAVDRFPSHCEAKQWPANIADWSFSFTASEYNGSGQHTRLHQGRDCNHGTVSDIS